MAQQRPLGAQISHMLKARGVSHVFGIPGVHNQELYRGIEEAGLTHILARHEQGAGFMADGYARASGRPGVCYLITGPGFVNAMTALGQAYSDSVSVLAVSSCLDETAARRGQLHQMRDQTGAGRTVCDWSEEATTAEAAYALIDRALGEFIIDRPRPKAVHVPIAQLEALADAPPPSPAPARIAEPVAGAVEATVRALQGARFPVFLFGGGVKSGFEAIPTILERTGAASFVTYAGRGAVPPEAPKFLGSMLARPEAEGLLKKSDLVVALGTELAQGDLWRPALGHQGHMVRVDLDAEVLAQGRSRDLAVRADAGAFLTHLASALMDTGPLKTEWDANSLEQTKALWRAQVSSEVPFVVQIADALRAAMPDDAMIYSDMTQLAYAAKEVWDMPRPGQWHHPTGFGTLGYALPAAIGGAVARPGLPTCCIIGDYGIQYTLPELGTAVELGLPIPILLWDNGKLGAIEDSMIAAQIAPNAVVQRNPDFLALARAWGAYAEEPSDPGALQASLTAAFQADGPTLIRMTPALLGA